jgi:TatD DNase family protein
MNKQSTSGMVDTHCHIHSSEFGVDARQALKGALDSGVAQIICVGTSGQDSEEAVKFASMHDGVFASIGLHPHDAKLGEDEFEILAGLVRAPKVVAVGECGIDYYYSNSSATDQKQALEYQVQLAISANLPLIFHVRDEKTHDQTTVGLAFVDFFEIVDRFTGVRGVVHSYTAGITTLTEIAKRGLYIGINGISTFTKDQVQKRVFESVDITKIVLETDSPFLTPTPLRGTMNSPANVRLVAACLAEMRGISLDELIEATTLNARKLFSLPGEYIK